MESKILKYSLIFLTILSIVQIGAELIPLFGDLPFEWYSFSQSPWFFYLQLVRGYGMGIDWFLAGSFSLGRQTNFINLGFYLLLLIGIILFFNTKGRETRLIRYLLAIVFLFNISIFVNWLVLFPVRLYQPEIPIEWKKAVFALSTNACYVFFSFSLLKILNKSKELAQDTTQGKLVPATILQRALHLFLDAATIVLFLSYTARVSNISLNQILDLRGDLDNVRYFSLSFVMILYYFISEYFLKATPAKLLLEAKVIGTDDQPLKVNTILLRTLCRFIPFEPLSFLSENAAWHDRWTRTSVVKEKRTGLSKGAYFWLGLFLLTVLFGISLGLGYYEHTRQNKQRWKSHLRYEAKLEQKLQDLSPTDIIQITKKKRNKDDKYYFLKVVKIEADRILVIPYGQPKYLKKPILINQIIEEKKDSVGTLWIERHLLDRVFDGDDSSFYRGKNYQPYLGTEDYYCVADIFPTEQPIIDYISLREMKADRLVFSICNEGWEGKITEIRNLIGDFDWVTSLPTTLRPASKAGSCVETFIDAENYRRGSHYKFEITIQNQAGSEQKWAVEGVNTYEKYQLLQE